MQVQDLVHVTRTTQGGGEVLVLNTGAVINAESEAMLAALHSRSIGGIKSHLEKLAKSGSEKFMSTFYVGYGHKSIGDCGSVTVFIENVSMLVAKAIQQSMLYNGQEASTRYIDFATQRFVDPHGSANSQEILENWRRFYLHGLALMQTELMARHPRKDDEKEDVYAKAIKARAFDVMRGFLPAGASTNLAWHGELRHVADHLDTLRHHPLGEVREIALALEDALAEVYPSSFQKKRYEATEAYMATWMKESYYYNDPPSGWPVFLGVEMDASGFDIKLLESQKRLLMERPKMTELPKFVAECGTLQFKYLLDFGSFRDNQRHRAVVQRMPLLTADYGFGQWYFDQLPETFKEEAWGFVQLQINRIKKLRLAPELTQYLLPMGMLVSCRKTGDLPAVVYLVERRARLDVHATMRKVAQDMGTLVQEKFKDFGLQLYMEMEGDRFYYDRGKQDIVEKASVA